jgi:exodeoxyribonuclease VII large subunit
MENIEAEIKEHAQQYTKVSFHKLAVKQHALQNALTRCLSSHHTILDEHKLILAKLPQKLVTRQQEKLQAAENDIRYFIFNLTESKKCQLEQNAKELKKESKRMLNQENDFLVENQKGLKESALNLLNTEKNAVKFRGSLIKTGAAYAINQVKFSLKEFLFRYQLSLNSFRQKAHRDLDNWEWKLNVHDPVEQLKRGYSLTYINGKVITSAEQIQAGEIIETRLANALIISQVITHQTYEQQSIDKRTPEATNI